MTKTRSMPATLTRKQLSRARRERLLQRYILIGAIVVMLSVVGVITYSLLNEYVFLPAQPVARVYDEYVNLRMFQEAVRFERYRYAAQHHTYAQLNQPQIFGDTMRQIQDTLDNSYTLGQRMLEDIISNLIIRAEAKKRGIVVTSEELEKRIQETFGYYANGIPTPTTTPSPMPTDVPPTVDPTRRARWTPTPPPTPTATFTPTVTITPGPSPTASPTWPPPATQTPVSAEAYATQLAATLADYRKVADVGEPLIRFFIESDLYREKLEEVIGAELVPPEADMVWARHILVRVTAEDPEDKQTAAKAKIDEVAAKLKAGEDWVTLAKQYSDDGTAQNGGDLGWFTENMMVKEFADVAFRLAPGAISDPVKTEYGWHIIECIRHEKRRLTADQLIQQRRTAFDNWLQQQRDGTDANGRPNVELFTLWQSHIPVVPTIPPGERVK